jgi:hypothetical protein
MMSVTDATAATGDEVLVHASALWASGEGTAPRAFGPTAPGAVPPPDDCPVLAIPPEFAPFGQHVEVPCDGCLVAGLINALSGSRHRPDLGAAAGWDSDDRGMGAPFHGRNQHPAVSEWTVPCCVEACEPNCTFGWRASDPDNPGARCAFELENPSRLALACGSPIGAVRTWRA